MNMVAKLDQSMRMAWLRVFLKVLSVGWLITFGAWITLILLNVPALAPGGNLAPLLRFQPYNPYYESMLTAIHIAWAIMLWRASGTPARHLLFIDFTILACAAHGLVMLIATPLQKGVVMTFIEGVPFFVVAAVLWWLRPNEAREHEPSASQGFTIAGQRVADEPVTPEARLRPCLARREGKADEDGGGEPLGWVHIWWSMSETKVKASTVRHSTRNWAESTNSSWKAR